MALVEREGELGRIGALLSDAREGRGSCVLVEGAAGIGKTALLHAVQDTAAADGVEVLVARGGELERELPFAIVRQLFDGQLRAAPPDERRDLFAGAARFAAAVFGGPVEGAAPADIGSVVHGLYWLCSNLSERRPLLICVDDVHWADEASLRFLSHLARRVGDLSALVVLAGRPSPPGGPAAAARALSGVPAHVLRLAPLTTTAVRAVVRSVLATDADEVFCDACARASGGYPFLLHEALAQLRFEGIAPVAGEAGRVDQLRPETVARSVLSRVGRLGPDAVRVVRAVAVLGPSADLRRTALLADLDVSRVAELVEALDHDAVLYARSPLEFVHPLVHTAIVADIPGALRAVAHKRAAELLAADRAPAEHLAPHLLGTDPAADPWVVETLQTAAASALATGAPEPAADYLARALAEPPAPTVRPAVLLALGRVLAMLSRSDESAEALAEAFALAGTPAERASAGMELATLMMLTDRAADAEQILAQLAATADPGQADLRLRRLAVLAFGRMYAMEPPSSWTGELDQVAGTLRGEQADEQLILALLAFGVAALGDRPAHEVARLAARATAHPLPERDPWLLVNAASAALTIAGQVRQGLDVLERGIDQARGQGDMTAFCYLSVLRSHTAIEAGLLAEAEADGRAAFDLAVDPQHRPLAAAVLVDALVERGEVAAAGALAEGQLSGDVPMSSLITHFVLLARGRLRLAQRRPQEALVDLLHCGDSLVSGGYLNPGFAHWRALAATAHLALGQVDAARGLIADELDRARRFGAPRAIGMALRISGLVEGGDAGLARLHESTLVLARSEDALEQARALVDLGAARRRSGQRTAALEPLRAGLDLATRGGARPLADLAQEELVAAGARPRRQQLTGPAALTPSELRVATRAAAKETNREIAQALFVSRRTVEIHLTNVYRKLHISSRHQLATVLK